MKALAKLQSTKGLWLHDAPEPEPGPNDVKIKVTRTAICGTDVHIYKWDEWAQKTIPVPMIVGHEFVGEIVDLPGGPVEGLSVGDHVASGAGVAAVLAGGLVSRRLPRGDTSLALGPYLALGGWLTWIYGPVGFMRLS
mgnify:CR=1 FL=1